MPLYEYKCPDHGVFQELAKLDDHDKPCVCPQCGLMSGRVLTLPPEFLNMLKEKRDAMERNEKSMDSPEFMTGTQYKEREQEREARHKHDKGCGCSSHKKSNLFYTADGNKMFPSMRPWMISH